MTSWSWTPSPFTESAAIICNAEGKTGYSCDYEVEVITHDQSGDIAGAVSGSSEMGAGDQGMAEAMVTSAKTSFHWEKVLLEVKTVDVFSYRLAMSWKNRFAPWMSMGR